MATLLNFSFTRLALITMLLVAHCEVSAQDTLTLERLDYKFVTLDGGRMSPVTSLASTDVAGTFVICDDETLLEFCSPNVFSVWVDGRYVAENQKLSRCIHLTSQELCAVSSRDTVYVSLVSKGGLQGITARSLEVKKEESVMGFPERRTLENGFWKIAFIVCGLILIVARFVVKKDFARIPKLTDTYNDKFFTIDNLIQLLVTCILGAFLWSYSKQGEPLDLLYMLGWFLFWWLLKTALNLISGILFRFRRQAVWQSNYLLQFWTIIFLLMFALAVFDSLFLGNRIVIEGKFQSILAVLEGLFVLSAIFIFRLQSGIKSLHRFIYLCTTEILPGVLIIHFFLE